MPLNTRLNYRAGNTYSSNELFYHLLNIKIVRKWQHPLPISSSIRSEIDDFDQTYRDNLNGVSILFEEWANNRRKILEKLPSCANTIKNARQKCCTGILAFSSLSMISSSVSLVLNSIDESWANKFYNVAAILASFTFFCSLTDVFLSRSKVEEIERIYEADEHALASLERAIWFGLFIVPRNFFPYRVNFKIMREIDPQFSNDIEPFLSDIESASKDRKIFCAIVLSNIMHDPTLFNDTYFIAKVQEFSRSTLAKKWWNRLRYENSSHHPEKTRLFSKVQSFMKFEESFNLLTIIATCSSFNAFILAFVSCLVSFNAYYNLKIQSEPKEFIILKRLEHVLGIEFNRMMNVYDQINTD